MPVRKRVVMIVDYRGNFPLLVIPGPAAGRNPELVSAEVRNRFRTRPFRSPRNDDSTFVHRVHQHRDVFGIDIRRDAMPEVEDVAGMRTEVVEHTLHFTTNHFG